MISGEILRSRIASVQQTCFLFNANVLENIHIANLDSGFGHVQDALAQAEADPFVDNMPQKFMVILAEDSDNLSGGQKQRLAIAGAFYAIWVETGMEFRGSSKGNSPEDHGYVVGTISFISNSSEEVNGVRLYRMTGQINNKEMLRRDTANSLLRPGAILSIEIRAGERRLISYLFDPFIKNFRTSLSEPS